MKSPITILRNFFARLFQRRQSGSVSEATRLLDPKPRIPKTTQAGATSSLDALADILKNEKNAGVRQLAADAYLRKQPRQAQGNSHPLVAMLNATKPENQIIIAETFKDKVTTLESLATVLAILPKNDRITLANACFEQIKPLIKYDPDFNQGELSKLVKDLPDKAKTDFQQKVIGLLTPERQKQFDQSAQPSATEHQQAQASGYHAQLANNPPEQEATVDHQKQRNLN